MSRAAAWRRQCPGELAATIAAAEAAQLLILARPGPTSFVVRERASESISYRVSIGNPSCCSCTAFLHTRELCVHLLWLLMKKLRLPHTNPLLWQLALVDREINEILRGAQPPPAAIRPSAADESADGGRSEVPARAIEPEDVCPICQCELTDGNALLYCKFGCGGSVHAACMLEWGKHAVTRGEQAIPCPLCRESYGSIDDLLAQVAPKKAHRVKRDNVHLGTSCRQCGQAPIVGRCYRCTVCASTHLCQSCFDHGAHSDHPFVCRERPWGPLTAVSRQMLPPRLAQALQERELTDADYAMLLLLDQPSGTPISASQLERKCPALTFHGRPGTDVPAPVCSVCQQTVTIGQRIRSLRCGHTFHISCGDGYFTTRQGLCPVDGSPVAGLRPAASPRRRRQSTVAKETQNASDGLIESLSELMVTGATAAAKSAQPVQGISEAVTRRQRPSRTRFSLPNVQRELRGPQEPLNLFLGNSSGSVFREPSWTRSMAAQLPPQADRAERASHTVAAVSRPNPRLEAMPARSVADLHVGAAALRTSASPSASGRLMRGPALARRHASLPAISFSST